MSAPAESSYLCIRHHASLPLPVSTSTMTHAGALRRILTRSIHPNSRMWSTRSTRSWLDVEIAELPPSGDQSPRARYLLVSCCRCVPNITSNPIQNEWAESSRCSAWS